MIDFVRCGGVDRVLVIACGALAHDLIRVRDANGWEYLDFQCLPAELHNQPQKIPEAVRDKIHGTKGQYQEIFVAYSDCGTGGELDRVLKEEGVERLPGAHCYEMFAGRETFSRLHEAELGTFYLTDFLARHFERLMIQGLGLDRHPELRDVYFRHYRKLVLLAQLDAPEIEKRARAAADFLGLTFEKVMTGDGELTHALKVRLGVTKRAA